MKGILVLMITGAMILNPALATEEKAPATKKVCIKTTDPATKKEVEKCRNVKIHEKHEGTTVPDGKKK